MQLEFTVPTWQLTTFSISSSTGSDTLSWAPGAMGANAMHLHTCRLNTHKIKMNTEKRKRKGQGT